MATYIKGEKNFYPEIKPFTPDYKFLSAALDAREAKYNAGWQATNDLYSRVYSDLSRADNQEFQRQFIEKLEPELSKISGLDLSLMRNVDAAKGVFAPFFEDDLVVKDIVYTSTYKDQMREANQFADSPIAEVRELYNPVGIKAMQYRLNEFMEADRSVALGMPLPEYVKDADLTQYAQNYLRTLGLEGKGLTAKVDRFEMSAGPDGVMGTADDRVQNRWIITDQNGELIKGDAYKRVMDDLVDDPRVQKFYDTKAYVASMDFATNAKNEGTVNTLQEGVLMWSQAEINRIDELNAQLTNNIEADLNDLLYRTTTWESFKKTNGVTPAEENYINEQLSEAEQLRVNLENLLGQNKFARTEDRDDQAIISKAYSMNKNLEIRQDLQRAAYNYSRENMERTIRENEYILQEDQFKYDMAKIQAKYVADSKIQEQKAKDARDLELLKNQIKNVLSLTEQVQQDGTVNVNDPYSTIYEVVDGEIVEVGAYEGEKNFIANKTLELTSSKASIIADMLKARYPEKTEFTVTLGGEEYTLDPQSLTTMLTKKKKEGEGTEAVETDEFLYFDDILRLFEEQSKWFKNKENVKNEKGLDYISEGSPYDKIFKRLYTNNPTDPNNLGLVIQQELFDDQVAAYEEELFNKLVNAKAAIIEGGEYEWFEEMVDAGYPMPYEEVNGVKRMLTLPEYQAKFKEAALSGKIKNFDVSGIGGDENAGADNEDWHVTKRYPTGSRVGGMGYTIPEYELRREVDMAAILGKSKALWELMRGVVDKEFSTIGGRTVSGSSRGLDSNTPYGNTVFNPTYSITSGTKPVAGSQQDVILANMLNQYNFISKDATSVVSLLFKPEDVKDFENFNVEAGVDMTDEEYQASSAIFNTMFNPDTKGKFKITYYNNLGAIEVDGEERNAMGGYVISDFDPAYRKEIIAAYEGQDILEDIKKAMDQGVMFVYDRTGGRDQNPNNFDNSSNTSYLEQKMSLSRDKTYTYEYNDYIAGFSPGKTVFQDLGNGKISVLTSINIYNPASTDINDLYITQTDSYTLEFTPGTNFSQDLNNRFFQMQQNFEQRDKLNNLAQYQQRALSMTEDKFVEEYQTENPSASESEAKSVYTDARALNQ